MADRVRIGVCSGPADAALVRSLFAAHDIQAVVGGEHHASLMGPLGGSFITLDIWVAADQADQASKLLADFRAATVEEPEGSELDASEQEEEDSLAAVSIESRISQRRQIGIALLLAMFITLGTAHLSTRAWLRGLALAAVEIIGFSQLGHDPVRGALLVGGSILTDAVGAIVRIGRLHARPALPAARLHQ